MSTERILPSIAEDEMRANGGLWFGKPIADLTREELFFALRHYERRASDQMEAMKKIAALV